MRPATVHYDAAPRYGRAPQCDDAHTMVQCGQWQRLVGHNSEKWKRACRELGINPEVGLYREDLGRYFQRYLPYDDSLDQYLQECREEYPWLSSAGLNMLSRGQAKLRQSEHMKYHEEIACSHDVSMVLCRGYRTAAMQLASCSQYHRLPDG